MEQQIRKDFEKRSKIDEFKALLIEHKQLPMSDAQTRWLSAEPLESISGNFDRTKAVLEAQRARERQLGNIPQED